MERYDVIRWVTWNTFLAIVPIVLAYAIRATARSLRSLPGRLLLALAAPAWLAFLPNTCYLLTEWRHFLATLDSNNLYLRSHYDSDASLQLLVYTAFYFVFSGVGMLAFALAIRPMARLAREEGISTWLLAIPLFAALSVGVYLGLVLRFNSWDLVTRPGEVFAAVRALQFRPRLLLFLAGFAAFLWAAYAMIDIWIDGLIARWRKSLS